MQCMHFGALLFLLNISTIHVMQLLYVSLLLHTAEKEGLMIPLTIENPSWK